MPLIVILAECGIELIPKHMRNKSVVRRTLSSKNYASQLLDNALHHSVMRNLKRFEKRGRPDISHICLLNILSSSLNKQGYIKIYVHTIHDKIFKFNPEIRISRNYIRFKGLMAKLLIDGEIKINGSYLISQFHGNLKDLITSFENPHILLFSSRGEIINNYKDLFSEDPATNSVIIIGGFQKSTFSKETLSLSNNLVSISKSPLDAWVVVYKVITYYEIVHNIL